MTAKIIAVLAYVCAIVFVAIIGFKRVKSFSDFFLGGRTVGPWLTAFTYGTTYFSAVLFIGFAGKIGWGFGMSGLWIALGNSLIGVLLVWGLLGSRIKKATAGFGVHTMPEYLAVRYDSPFLKYFSAAIIFIFLIPYTAAVFMGLSYLFETNFGMPYWLALTFMGVFTGVYLIMGGYKSMAMIDFIFGIIMLFGVGILYGSCVSKAGGLTSIFEQLKTINPKLIAPIGPPGFWPLFSLVFLTSVAPMAMPQLLQKFYAIKDAKSVKIGMIASTIFAIIITGVAYFIGALTRIFITPETNPNAFAEVAGRLVPNFDSLMPELLTYVIPPSLSIVILLLILSASMSTLAALVLISSSTVVKDLYGGLINRNADDSKLTLLMRICGGIFLIISILIALLKPAVIVTILSISWGAIASAFLGAFVWGILTKSAGFGGAVVSCIAGLGTCLILYFVWGSSAAPQAGTVGMIVSLIIPLLFMPFARKKA